MEQTRLQTHADHSVVDAPGLFGRGIREGSPDKRMVVNKMTYILHIDCADEVYQPDVEGAGVDKYIVWFDAAVNDSCFVDLIQGLGKSAGDDEKIV